jgi:hypothetical protein
LSKRASKATRAPTLKATSAPNLVLKKGEMVIVEVKNLR